MASKRQLNRLNGKKKQIIENNNENDIKNYTNNSTYYI